jgi:hypothetical protein
LWKTEHRVQIQSLRSDTNAGLLSHLPCGGLLQGLAIFHESRRNFPEPIVGFTRTTAHQKPVFEVRNAGNEDLGIDIVDFPTTVAEEALARISHGASAYERIAATTAEFHITPSSKEPN